MQVGGSRGIIKRRAGGLAKTKDKHWFPMQRIHGYPLVASAAWHADELLPKTSQNQKLRITTEEVSHPSAKVA